MTTGALLLSGGDLVIPAELLKELHAELTAPRQAVPLNVTTPRRTRQIAELVDLVLTGAIAHHQAESGRKRVTLSQPSPVPPSVTSAPAGSLSMGGEVVSVAVAAEMLGFSPQWVRELARAGALPGAYKGRGVGNGRGAAHAHWCIPLASVHAYLQTREVAR